MTTMTTDQTEMTTPLTRAQINAPTRLAIAALTLGWLFDWAFYDKPLGISLAIYVGLLVTTLLAASWYEHVKPQRGALLLLAPLLFFAAMVAIRANPFLTFLNICTVLLLLMLYAYFFAGGKVAGQRTLDYFMLKPLAVMIWSLTGTFGLLRAVQVEQRERENTGALVPVLRGLLLALPILLVFGALLLSADLIFAQRVEQWIDLPNFGEIVGRMMLILFVAWLAAGALVYALTRDVAEISAEQRAKSGTNQTVLPFPLRLGFIESSVILNTVNLLFLAFVAVQFSYLFGGAKNIKLDGFTYAEYARRGFFELVAVAVLTLALILILKKLTIRNTGTQTIVYNLSSSVMVFCVTIMLISAFRRLRLYELTYGFTEDRVLPHVFMVWLAIVFGWFIITLWRKSDYFAIGLLIGCLGYVATLNVMNVDAFIVRQNWARYQLLGGEVQIDWRQVGGRDVSSSALQSAQGLDLQYLMTLSNDATGELVAIVNQLPTLPTLIEEYDYDISDYVVTPYLSAQEALISELEQRESAAVERSADAPWQSYHLAHARALKLLSK
jgi:hypothetical protein